MGCRPGRDRNTMIRVRTRTNRRHASVTTREIDVLRLLSRGYTYAEIGAKLEISVHTVTSHIKKSYRKLGVHSAAAAVTRAAELGLFDRTKDG